MCYSIYLSCMIYKTNVGIQISSRLHTHTHNRFTALWKLSGTTRMSRYQKKHSPTTLIVVISHPYLLSPSTTTHGILCIQSTCSTVFYHNLSPSFLWSTSWPSTLGHDERAKRNTYARRITLDWIFTLIVLEKFVYLHSSWKSCKIDICYNTSLTGNVMLPVLQQKLWYLKFTWRSFLDCSLFKQQFQHFCNGSQVFVLWQNSTS